MYLARTSGVIDKFENKENPRNQYGDFLLCLFFVSSEVNEFCFYISSFMFVDLIKKCSSS